MSAKNHTALIIDGGKILGSGCARELAKDGANLALQYDFPKGKDEMLKLRDELLKAHSGIKVSIHDKKLNTDAGVEKLFSEVLAEHNEIDIVVNSVGVILKKPTQSGLGNEHHKYFAYAVFVDEQRKQHVDQLQSQLVQMQHSS